MRLKTHLDIRLINRITTALKLFAIVLSTHVCTASSDVHLPATTTTAAHVVEASSTSPAFAVVETNKRIGNTSLEATPLTTNNHTETKKEKHISKQPSASLDDNGVTGFNYNKPPKPCLDSGNCDARRGETCRYLYEGCNVGQCMCESDLSRDGVTETCHDNEKKFLNDSCINDLDCTGGMHCRGGLCRCSQGGVPTEDGSFCLVERRHRLVGSACNPSVHTCLQKAIYGYTSYDVECDTKRSVCSCVNGFKTEDITCSRRKVGETGCYRSYNCDGGSICVDETCRCPTGYHVPRSYDKCIKKGATTNLGLGSPCDEINEKRYCSQHLICYRCHASLPYKCVRYININKFSRLTSVASVPGIPPREFLLVVFILLITIIISSSSISNNNNNNNNIGIV